MGEEHTSPTGKRSPVQVTLDRWEGLRASQGRSCPSRALQPVQPWDLGGLSQGVPQLEVVTFCFLLGRVVICILLREDSVPFLLGCLFFFFFWFLLFFQISEQGHCLSPNTPDSTPPPGVLLLQPPLLLAISSRAGEHLWSWPPARLPAPPPTPIPHHPPP